MKITYREENGCLYPNLELPKQTNYTIGKYGLLHLDYIKEHRKGRYTTLVSECRLSEYLHKIDEQAREQLNIYILYELTDGLATLKEAVEAYLANNLGYNPNVKCDHHDHEHGNGAHSCGNHGCGTHNCGGHRGH